MAWGKYSLLEALDPLGKVATTSQVRGLRNTSRLHGAFGWDCCRLDQVGQFLTP